MESTDESRVINSVKNRLLYEIFVRQKVYCFSIYSVGLTSLCKHHTHKCKNRLSDLAPVQTNDTVWCWGCAGCWKICVRPHNAYNWIYTVSYIDYIVLCTLSPDCVYLCIHTLWVRIGRYTYCYNIRIVCIHVIIIYYIYRYHKCPSYPDTGFKTTVYITGMTVLGFSRCAYIIPFYRTTIYVVRYIIITYTHTVP